MIEVTKDVFFKTVGPLDVHPRVDVATLKERKHVSNWEMNHTRKRVGRSIPDSHGIDPTLFFLGSN